MNHNLTTNLNKRIKEIWSDYKDVFLQENYNLITLKKEKMRAKKKEEESLADFEKRLKKKIDEDIIADFRLPLLFPPLPDKCELLFVGLNPSFSTKDICSIVTNNKEKLEFLRKGKDCSEHHKNHINQYFKYQGTEIEINEKLENLQIFESISSKSHPYFSKFGEIAREYFNDNVNSASSSRTNSHRWTHIDLFFIRETSANKIKAYYGNEVLKDFFYEQVKITVDAINELNPKIVLVANAFASRILKEHYSGIKVFKKSKVDGKDVELYNYLKREGKNYSYIESNDINETYKIPTNKLERVWNDFIATTDFFEDDYGTYKLKEDDTFFFFSGMLTGQRALDLDSYKRLRWHIMEVKRLSNLPKRKPSP